MVRGDFRPKDSFSAADSFSEKLGSLPWAGRQLPRLVEGPGFFVLRSWVIVAVSVAVAWPAGAAYLPLLGPGALRYERPVRAVKAPLPPLPEPPAAGVESPASSVATPPAPVPPPAMAEPPAASSTNAPPTVEELAPPLPSLPTSTNAPTQPAPPAAQPSAEPEITPQMLVQYFKMPVPNAPGTTNAAGVIVTLPLFQPPQPGRIPPSSARYETPEPQRPAP